MGTRKNPIKKNKKKLFITFVCYDQLCCISPFFFILSWLYIAFCFLFFLYILLMSTMKISHFAIFLKLFKYRILYKINFCIFLFSDSCDLLLGIGIFVFFVCI